MSLKSSLLFVLVWTFFWPVKVIDNMWAAYLVETSWLSLICFSILYVIG